MTELAENVQQADALPLGPESLVWRYFGDNRMYLIGPRPAVLQNMLAELGQGVLDHSVFFADTAARVKRSTFSATAVTPEASGRRGIARASR